MFKNKIVAASKYLLNYNKTIPAAHEAVTHANGSNSFFSHATQTTIKFFVVQETTKLLHC